ncbi:MAG: sulfatase-like hydrolase/transferase [Planctomycetota bacterium]
MTGRKCLFAAILIVISGCSKELSCPENRRAVQEGKSALNLLVITLDTSRADHFGCYGCKEARTPNIDALAASGVLFEEAFTPVPLTLASHASIFTGNFPPYHGVHTNTGKLLDEANQSLAEIFKGKGYTTAAFIGADVLHRRTGINQGFDLFDDDFSDSKQLGDGIHPEKIAETVVGSAIDWIDRNSGSPFFLWVHLYDPHHPFSPPGEYGKEFQANPYDGEIAYSDHWIGKLLEKLDNEDLIDETLVAFLSDHGEGLGDHDEDTHGIFIYDSTLHVPFILSCRKLFPPGKRVPGLVRTIDLVPTVLDLYGIPKPKEMQGVGLVPMIDGLGSSPLTLYAESYLAATDFGWSHLLGIRTADWKAIYAPKPELYNLHDDFKETDNKADESKKIADELLDRLGKWVGMLKREGVTELQKMDAKTRDSLQALGYVSGSNPTEFGLKSKSEIDPKDKTDVINGVNECIFLCSRNRYKEAVGRLQELLKLEPGHARMTALLAESYLKTKDLKRAKEVYLQVLRLDPRHENALANLGTIHLIQNDPMNAIPYLERALTVNPENKDALYGLGAILYSNPREKARAQTYFQRFLDAAPNDSRAKEIRALLKRF